MTERITLRLWDAQQAYREIVDKVWPWIKQNLIDGTRMVLLVHKEKHSDTQRGMMWSCMTDLSDQVTWFGKKMTKEGWKSWITGHLDGQELHPDMHGTGFISVTQGKSTSDMTKAEMTAVIELAHAFGAQQGVNWRPTSLGRQPGFIDPDTGEVAR